MKEYLLSTNNFGEPKVYSENEARGLNIIRLLLLTPGHNPLFPDMGCNLAQFRYVMTDQLNDIKQLVADQMNTYLPECLMDSVNIEITDTKYLHVVIQCQDIKYIYQSEDTMYPISLEDTY